MESSASVSKEEMNPSSIHTHDLTMWLNTKVLSGVLNSRLLPCRASSSRTPRYPALPCAESLTLGL